MGGEQENANERRMPHRKRSVYGIPCNKVDTVPLVMTVITRMRFNNVASQLSNIILIIGNEMNDVVGGATSTFRLLCHAAIANDHIISYRMWNFLSELPYTRNKSWMIVYYLCE